MENLIQEWTHSGPFFPKSGHLFQFSKESRRDLSLSPGCAHASVAEYVQISLKILENAWINYSDHASSLNITIILHVRQTFEDAFGSKCARVLNMAWLHKQRLHRIMSEHGSIGLNIAEYCWMSLNMPDNAWINFSDYARVFNVPHHLRYLAGFWICLKH